MSRRNFDCIIIGAGCAGSTLGKKLAEAGFDILIIDRKQEKKIGYSWEVALEKSVFGRTAIKFPAKKYWEQGPDVSRYFVKDPENHIEVQSSRDDGFFIRHCLFNQHLLNLAKGAGAEIRDSHWVSEMVIDKDRVTGITGNRKGLLKSKSFHYNGKIIIDASGIDAVLRKQSPDSFLIKRRLYDHDFAYGWNEVREVNDIQVVELGEKLKLFPGMLYTRLGKYHAYEVIHLRKNNTVNLIFGAAYNRKGRSARSISNKFLNDNPHFGPRIYGGGGLIPLRRSIDSMVAGGFLCIGDAACQVIPTMGSGVATSMHAADIASRIITDALNRDDVSREFLWAYNQKYQTKRGAILATYDIIRLFLQSMTAKDMDDVFRAGLITNESFISTFSSHLIKYNVLQVLENILKILNFPNLLPIGFRFAQTLRDSEKALKLYKNYPAVFNEKNFNQWCKATNELFAHYGAPRSLK